MKAIARRIKAAVARVPLDRRLWLLLWGLCMLSLVDIPGSPVFMMGRAAQWAYVALAGAFKASVMYVPLALMMRRRAGRVVALTLICLFALLAVANALCWRFYEFGITRKLFVILSQTTPRETSEFLPGLVSNVISLAAAPSTYTVMAAAVAVVWLMLRLRRRIAWIAVAVLTVSGMASFAVFCTGYLSGRTAHSLVLRTAKYLYETIEVQRAYVELSAEYTELPYRETVRPGPTTATVVVVIGESASRKHLLLYGYGLPTSPLLDSMADSLYVFTDAIGSSSCTAGNMERILTFKKDDDTYGDALSYPGVIDLFKAAGYRTWWLSNQERVGAWSNVSGILSQRADVVRYVGADNSEDALAVRYDGALLPEYAEALADTAATRLIFLHLMGSHSDYAMRYPEEWARFSADDEYGPDCPWLDQRSADRRAAYDNSILYTDYILSRVMAAVAALPGPGVAVYFSDHGENVYDEGKFCGRGRRYVEVPFVVYANAAYRRAFPDVTARLAGAVDRPFSTANVVYMLMSLTGVGYALYDPADDVLSPQYVRRPRMVDEAVWDAPGGGNQRAR